MSTKQKFSQILITFIFIAGMLAPAGQPSQPQPVRIQPQLAELAASTPQQMLRVIVQKTDASPRAESLVHRCGGQVLVDLPIINAFAAELPARAVPKLASSQSVHFVSLDAPVVSTAKKIPKETFTLLDRFDSQAYDNNDGSASWTSDWMEYDLANLPPVTGDVYAEASLPPAYPDEGGDYAAAQATAPVAPLDPITGDVYSNTDEGSSSDPDGGASAPSAGEDPSLQPSSGDVYLSEAISITLAPEVGVVYTPYLGPVETGATSGNIFINNGELTLRNWSDTGTQPSVVRQADLSDGLTSATLSFTFRAGPGVDENEDLVIFEVSSDGGATYTTLSTFNLLGGAAGTSSHNILPYAAPKTRFRFRIMNGFQENDEYFAVDNFTLEYEGSSLPKTTYLDTLNVRPVWDMGYTGTGIGVAVIDSGVSQDRDFDSLYKVSFSANSSSVNDFYGHGTHVAGIIAGNGTDSDGQYMGIAPGVDLISLKISDDAGMAYVSDTVEAMQWVFDHQAQYNIRVVNLSIQSTMMSIYHLSPLDAAAEILWFSGIVVVAASGNWDDGDFYNPILAAPANDPFIITVGATTEKGTSKRKDDSIPPFTPSGMTLDGFLKPDIFAPGKDIISVLSKNSDWDEQHPDRSVFNDQYFRLSGTSMAAPMVTGAVALLLQAEPNLTPDQVKYRLIHTAGAISKEPYLDVEAALTTPTSEPANQEIVPHMLLAKMALIAYWASQNGEENVEWSSVDWEAVNWDVLDWEAVDWNAVNWNAVNWNAVNWNAVNWNAVNWNAVNWNAVNWNAVNWNAVNWNAVDWSE
jgi:serine protease AprX